MHNPDFNKIITEFKNTIYIQTHKFGHAFDRYHDELLFDFFSTYYTGHPIIVVASDGENLSRRGVVGFFEDLCQRGILTRELITFASYDRHWAHNFKHKNLGCHTAFKGLRDIVKIDPIKNINKDAKFIGCLISRFTPARFNLAYQIDKTFPNDNFLTFRPNKDSVNNFYSLVDSSLSNIYQEQLNWLNTKNFDVDTAIADIENVEMFLPWIAACNAYHSLWPKYHIECVIETDVFSNSFPTEKTAKCLISAKPFVLMAGTGSLKFLNYLGFKTYNDILDESYDDELTPNSRMTAMIRSLKELYLSHDRQIKIDQLNQIAKYNQSMYTELFQTS